MLLIVGIGNSSDYLYLFTSRKNLGGDNGKSGKNSDGLDEETEEAQYVFDGLNYALIAQMNESYFKELMTLYLQASEGNIDGFTFHPTPDSFLALQIQETGYYDNTQIPLSYLPFENGEVVWNREYKDVAASKMTIMQFGTDEWKKITSADLNLRMKETKKVKTPWHIAGDIKNVATTSPTGEKDFRYLPNDVVYLIDIYNQALDKLNSKKEISTDVASSLDDYFKKYMMASTFSVGAEGTLQSLYGIAYSKTGSAKYLDSSKTNLSDAIASSTSFYGAVVNYLTNSTSKSKWYKNTKEEERLAMGLILAYKTEGLYLSQKAYDSIPKCITDVWKSMYPEDEVGSLDECKAKLHERVKSLAEVLSTVTGDAITTEDTKNVYRTANAYDDSPSRTNGEGFIFSVSSDTSEAYLKKFSNGNPANLVSAISTNTLKSMISTLMLGEKYYADMLKLGGLSDVDVTDPRSYKNKVLASSSSLYGASASSLDRIYAQCEVNSSLLSPQRVEVLNAAATKYGKTHYYWGGGHSHQASKGEDAQKCATVDGLYDLDCSGYASWAYNTCGFSDLFGATGTLLAQGRNIGWSDIRPADLVVSESHVLIFVSTDSNGNSWFIDVGGGGSGWTCATNDGPKGCRLRTVSLSVFTSGTGGDTIRTNGESSDSRAYRVVRSKQLESSEATATFVPSTTTNSSGSNGTDTNATAGIKCSESELQRFRALMVSEIGGGTQEQMYNVAAAICNRVRSSQFPNTIEGVILQPGQFEGSSEPSIWTDYSAKYQDKALMIDKAIKEALQGTQKAQSCTFFETLPLSVHESNGNLEYVFTDNAHKYFRIKGESF